MTSYPSTHAAMVARMVTTPSSTRIRRKVRMVDVDVVKHHTYRDGTHPVEDRPTVRVSPLAVGGSPRTRGILGRDWSRLAERNLGPQDRWGDVVGRFDETTPKAACQKSSEIKPPVVRAFTGKKASQSQDALAERMRAGVQDQWDATQAPYAVKTMKATNKLGAGK